MRRKKLTWFALLACLLIGTASCKKEESATDQRLINKENKEAGERFLKENETKSGVKKTYTGLQYEIKVLGNGSQRPLDEDSVNVTYTGRLIDGTEFTSATESLLVSKQIAGFKEGLKLMTTGATYTLYIPYFLAYGSSSKSVSYNDKTITIQPYSALIFEVTLNEIKKK